MTAAQDEIERIRFLVRVAARERRFRVSSFCARKLTGEGYRDD